jgi:hypothetical protein
VADPQPTLEAQVAAGARRLEDAARATNAAEDAKLAEERRRRDGALAGACARVSPLDAYGLVGTTYFAIPVGAWLMFMLGVSWGVWVLFGAIAAAYLLGVLFVRLRARRRDAATLAAERAWVLALPFHLVRYEDLFVVETRRRFGWHLRLVFGGPSPEPEMLRALFANVAAAPSVHVGDEGVDLTLPFVQQDFDLAVNHRFLLRLLFHRTVDECLRPLHAKHPLDSVAPRLDDRWGT